MTGTLAPCFLGGAQGRKADVPTVDRLVIIDMLLLFLGSLAFVAYVGMLDNMVDLVLARGLGIIPRLQDYPPP
eukprot:1104497-Prorocentrum_lima.AAC.1